MFVLGVTGGIGSGKSTVSGLLAERGLVVLDADEISRNVTAPGGRAMPEIAATFGNKVITSNGALNRRVMSEISTNATGSPGMSSVKINTSKAPDT